MPATYDKEQSDTATGASENFCYACLFPAADVSDDGNTGEDDGEKDGSPQQPDEAWIPRRAGEVTASDIYQLLQRYSDFFDSAGMLNMKSALWEETGEVLSKLDRGRLAPGDAMLAVKHAIRKLNLDLYPDGASEIGFLARLFSPQVLSSKKSKLPRLVEKPFFLKESTTPEEWQNTRAAASGKAWSRVAAMNTLPGSGPVAGEASRRRKAFFEPVLASVSEDGAPAAPEPAGPLDLRLPDVVRELAFAFAWMQIGFGMLEQHTPAQDSGTDHDEEDVGRLLVMTGMQTLTRILTHWSAPLGELLLRAIKTGCADIWNRLWHGRLPDGQLADDEWFPDRGQLPSSEPGFDPAVFERQFTANFLMLWAHVSGDVRKVWDDYGSVPRRNKNVNAAGTDGVAQQEAAVSGELQRNQSVAAAEDIGAFLREQSGTGKEADLTAEIRAFQEMMADKNMAAPAAMPGNATADALMHSNGTSTVQFSVGYVDQDVVVFEAADSSFSDAAWRNEPVGTMHLKERIDPTQGLQSAAGWQPQTSNSTVGTILSKEAKLAGEANAVLRAEWHQSFSEPSPNPLLAPKAPVTWRSYIEASAQRWAEKTGQLRIIHIEFQEATPDLAQFQAVHVHRNGTMARTAWEIPVSKAHKKELLSIARPAKDSGNSGRIRMNVLSGEAQMLLQPGMRFFDETQTAAEAVTAHQNASISGPASGSGAEGENMPAGSGFAGLIKDINRMGAAKTALRGPLGMAGYAPAQWQPRIKRVRYPATGIAGGVAAADEAEARPLDGMRQQSLPVNVESDYPMDEPEAEQSAESNNDRGQDDGDNLPAPVRQHVADGDQGLYLYRLDAVDSTVTPAVSLASGSDIIIEISGSQAWLAAHLAGKDWNFHAGQVVTESEDRAVVTYADFGKDVTFSIYGKTAVIEAVKKLLDADIAGQPRTGHHHQADGERTAYRLNERDTLELNKYLRRGTTIRAEAIGEQAWPALRLTGTGLHFNPGRMETQNAARDYALVSYTDTGKGLRVEISGKVALINAIKKLTDDDILNKQRELNADPEEDETNTISEGFSMKLPDFPKRGVTYTFELAGSTAWLALHLTGERWNFNIGMVTADHAAPGRMVVIYADVMNDVRCEISGETGLVKAIQKLIDADILARQRRLYAEQKEIEAILPTTIAGSDGQTFLEEFYRQIGLWINSEGLDVQDEVRKIVEGVIPGHGSRTFYAAVTESIGHPVTRFLLIELLAILAVDRVNSLDDAKKRIQRLGGGRFDINEKTHITCHIRLTNKLSGFEWEDEFPVTLGEALRGKVYGTQEADMVSGDSVALSYVWPDHENDAARYDAFRRAVQLEKIRYPDFGGKEDAPAFPSLIESSMVLPSRDELVQDAPGGGEDAKNDDKNNGEGKNPTPDLIAQTIKNMGGTRMGLGFDKSTPFVYKIEVFDGSMNKVSTTFRETSLSSALNGKVFRMVTYLLEGKVSYRARMSYAVVGFDHETEKYNQFGQKLLTTKLINAALDGFLDDFAFPLEMKNIRGELRVFASFNIYRGATVPFHPYWKSILKAAARIKELKGEGRGPDMALEFAQKRLIYLRNELDDILTRNHTNAEVGLKRATILAAEAALEEIVSVYNENLLRIDDLEKIKEDFERKDNFLFEKKFLPFQEFWGLVGNFSTNKGSASGDSLILKIDHSDGSSSSQPIIVPEDFEKPDEWTLVAANLANKLDILAAGKYYRDGWIVPGTISFDGEDTPASTAEIDFHARRNSGIKSISLEREKQINYKKPLENTNSTVYSKPLAIGEEWKKVGDITAGESLPDGEDILLKMEIIYGNTNYLEIDVPDAFRGQSQWPLYVANEINRLTDFAAGERKTPAGMITPCASAVLNHLFVRQKSSVEKLSVMISDKKVDDYLSASAREMDLVADIRGDSKVKVEFHAAKSTFTAMITISECLRGGIHNLIKTHHIGDDGSDVNISYLWPWTVYSHTVDYRKFNEKIGGSSIIENPGRFDIPSAFPDQIRNKRALKLAKSDEASGSSGNNIDITITTAAQCQREIESIITKLTREEDPDSDLILRSPYAFLAQIGERIYRKHKMPFRFDPEEMVEVIYETWSDSAANWLAYLFFGAPAHEVYRVVTISEAVHSYRRASVSQRVLISGNLKRQIRINSFNLASGSEKLPNDVFQDLISADPSVEYREMTAKFYSNRDFRRVTGKGYKTDVLKIMKQHTRSIAGYDPEQRLLKGDAKVYSVEFSGRVKKVRLGKTLMYSDEENSIHFLVMPDSGVSKTISNPDEGFTLRSGSNWSILADMLDSTRDEALITLILAHFRDKDFEDQAFITAFGAAYVDAVKAARDSVLKADYVHAGALTGHRLSEITIEIQMNQYWDDFAVRLNDIMDDMTMSQSELKRETIRHAVGFAGSLVTTGLTGIAIVAGVAGGGAAATALGVAGLTTSIATTTGLWLTADYNANYPVQAETAFRAWLVTVVADTLFFIAGVVPISNLVFRNSAGSVMTNILRSQVAARMIERKWGAAVGLLGLRVNTDIDAFFSNAIAEELMKQGMPDPRTESDYCKNVLGNNTASA